MLPIILQGETVHLLPERALYWPAQKTLIVADLHWGKGAHFRKHGIAIPLEAQPKDEIRLAKLIRAHDAERLVIAGDMFHSAHNNEVATFSHWRQSHAALHIDLVLGNHDRLAATHYEDWRLTTHSEGLHMGPFYITHDVPTTCEAYCIHGHVHPAVRIKPAGRHQPAMKLDCFCEDADRLILPAFGAFTGNHLLRPDEHGHLYVIADDRVMQWT